MRGDGSVAVGCCLTRGDRHAAPAFGRVEPLDVLQGALNDTELRQRRLAETRKVIDAYQGGAPLVVVTHGSVVTDLTGLNIRMGEFVVLRRAPDGTRVVAGQLYVE